MGIYDSVMGRFGKDGTEAASAPGLGAATDPIQYNEQSFAFDLPEIDEETYARVFKNTGTPQDRAYESAQAPTAYGPGSRGAAIRADDRGGTQGGAVGQITRLAKSFQGTPYVWGGTSPSGFDCSGFVQYVYAQAGVKLPRVSFQQARAGQRVELGNLAAGDLVAWDNSTRNNGADHIAIYLGSGMIAEAPRAGVPLRVRKLSNNEQAWGVRVLK